MVWSFVNTTSAQVTDSYGQEVSNNINGLNEDFIITNVSFNSATDNVTVWFYNNGATNTKIQQILVWGDSTDPTVTSYQKSLTLQKGAVGWLNVTRTLVSEGTYYVEAVGQYGSTYTTYGKAS